MLFLNTKSETSESFGHNYADVKYLCKTASLFTMATKNLYESCIENSNQVNRIWKVATTMHRESFYKTIVKDFLTLFCG